MTDVDALAGPKADNKPGVEPVDIGSVADFIEILNATVGKHFKCCICLSILGDPVMLPCNHPLCRGCAKQCLRQNQRCPQCLTAIPNLRMLQGRNKWIAEMVGSLKNCLNEVGVSLTQHTPVPPKYRDNPTPKPGAARASAAGRERARARARAGASSGGASRAQRPSASCGGSAGGRGRGEARRKGRGGSSGASRDRSVSTGARPTPSSWPDNENAVGAPSPPPSPSPPPPPPQRPFVVGDLVFVEHRSWPGMNKHGGVALVTAVLDPPGSRYDVKYSVSRKFDRGVEARYVHTYAFPEDTVGGRSRRGGGGSSGDTRARRHSGGGIGSGSGSLSPRGRLRTPVIAPAAGARAAGSIVTAASATAVVAAPVPQPSPPRRAVDNSGEQVETSDEEGSDREHTPSAAAAAAPAAPAPAATPAATPAPTSLDAMTGVSAAAAAPAPAITVLEREGGEEGQGEDDNVLRHHDDEESTCDDAGEGSCHSDATLSIPEGEQEEEGVNRGEYSSDNGDGDYGGGSSNNVHDDDGVVDNDDIGDIGDGDGDGGSHANDLGAAAPLAEEGRRKYHEGRPAAGGERRDGEGEIEAPAVALSPSDATEKGVGEEEAEETMEEEEEGEEEEEEDLAYDSRKSPTIPSVGSRVAGAAAAAGGAAAPLSPTSRSNLPWRPMGLGGLEKEQPRAGQHRRRDPPSSTSSSGARDPMLAGAAEGLMALAANSATPIAGVEGEREHDSSMDDANVDDDRAETRTLSPQSPKQNPALGHSSSSSSHRGEVVASAGTEVPLGVLAAAAALETAASPSASPPRHSSCPEQHGDSSAAARAAGGSEKDDDGDVPPASDLARPASSTEVVVIKSGAGARAATPKSPAPSASSPSPLPPSRPSGLTAVGPQQRTPCQVMPPPPPSFPSPTSTRPPNASSSSSSSSSRPLPPLPTPKTPAFKVGDLVSVLSRSSPGVNKEGGVAKVTAAHPDGTFDVKYIVRKGKEKGVSAAIISSYAVDDESGGGGGGSDSGSGSGRRDSGGRGSAGAGGVASGSSSSSSSSSVDAARGGARTVRRTPRANKGWCSPDLAAGQANAACLSYLLGETQHQELDLDPDLGELLDPSEFSSSIDSSTSAPAGKARRHREASSSGAAVNAAEEEKIEENDDDTAASGREIRGGGGGGSGRRGRGTSRGNGKRKRTGRDGDDDDGDGDGGGNEQQVSGEDRGRSSQERERRRRRSSTSSNSTSEGSTSGTGGGGGSSSSSSSSSNDVFDILALSAGSSSKDAAAVVLTTAVVDSDGDTGGDGSRNVFDIAALSAGSDSGDSAAAILTTAVTGSDGRSGSSSAGARLCEGLAAPAPAPAPAPAAAAAADKKRDRPPGSVAVLREATADCVGWLPGTKKKSKATVAKAGASSSSCGGGSGGREQGASVNGRRGRVAAAETEAGGAVVLTMSGSTAEMSTVAGSLAKSLGWIVEPKYTEEVTHVVCGTVPKNTKAKVRSAKFLRAVASGKWVVTEGWLQECKRRRARVDEAAFEVSGDKKSVVPSAPTRSRLAHADAGRPGLFQGITFHFRGEFGTTGSPPLSELEPMLLANGGRVVNTIGSLFTRPAGAGGEGEGRRGNGGGGSGGGSGNGGGGSGGWRPRRVVIFQPSSASPAKDARELERELAASAEVELAPQSASSESARSGGGRGGPDNMAVEVVKPIWLVDSVGCFRVLKPTMQHRLPSFAGGS